MDLPVTAVALTVALLSANVFLLIGLAVIGWRNRARLGAQWFSVLTATAAVWVGLTIGGFLMGATQLQLQVWRVQVALSLVTSIFWIGFILSYTGREQWLRPLRFGTVTAPLIGGAVLYVFAPQSGGIIQQTTQLQYDGGTLVSPTIGPVGTLVGVYLYSLFLAGLVIVMETVVNGDRLVRGQALALIAGTLSTVIPSAARLFGVVPIDGYPVTQLALGIQALFWGSAVFRQDLLRYAPGVARLGERATVDDLADGILVVNEDGIVVRANERVEDIVEATDVTGQKFESLLSSLGDCHPESLPCQFERNGAIYQATSSTVTDRNDRQIGRSVVFRDVTELVRHQQRLQVLNRILRHNVRNDVTVIRGAAEELSDHSEDSVRTLSERITRRAQSLGRISDKARDIEQISSSEFETELVDPHKLLEKLVTPFEERYPDATVTCSTNASAIRTNRLLLSIVLEEAIENGLDHGGDPSRVDVSAVGTETAIEFTITDNGPGIPDWELAPIRSGEETPLQHASGLGLWILNWGVQSMNGSVEFEKTSAGTTVTISIPRKIGGEEGTTFPVENVVAGASLNPT